ncbi:MAG: putative acetyltransferase [Bacteroidetes bacterium]|nr:putative acetyltransferase [Bacteroidota bacterium]
MHVESLQSVEVGSIRSLRCEDRESIHQLLFETGVFTDEEVGIALELIDIVLHKPDQRDYVINVYEDANEVLGYYCVGPTPATESTFDLYWIATKPSAQGKGIGGRLDDHALNLIRSIGGRLVIAETSSQPKYEKTRQFYRTRQYTELARIRDYYRAGDDLVVYGKYLT